MSAYFAGKSLYDKQFNLPFCAGVLLILVVQILVVLFIKEDEKYKVRAGEKMKFEVVCKKASKNSEVTYRCLQKP